MIQVSIIGSGNVAQHLIKAFSQTTEIGLVQVFSRKPELLTSLVPNDKIISNYNLLKAVDLLIIAVTDNAIAGVSDQIPFENQLVVHTSGSVSMDALNSKNHQGVFYPLQTFSVSKEVDFNIIPICLEATTEKDYQILETIAKSISEVVYHINSEQRKALHVAAVFVSNFVNYLYQIGNEICHENDLPFDILKPLITETANKIKTLSPAQAQTGPAKRNDTQTINAHLSFLKNDNQKEIYKLLTKSIIDNGKKL
ncbi:Rossmann-like and DUF2520 domain-containing protein [Flavobacterium sp. RSB2_4_14]|uniref:Rossmann-like and DUF2520 domain-containing protein n=1 Tax=Flavobacterium sp. RSB2_4_14 TaxID=3447665 RepID=UPI003F2CDB59